MLDTRLRFIRRLIYASILLIGIAVALSQFTGLSNLAKSILASGALAAAIIGFAARQTLANVVAGIMLAITQPLRVGDWVTFEEQYGVVEDVRLNYTVLRTPGDVRVVIPNERLAAGILRNDTLGSDRIALDVSVWLAPGADVERALAVLADATGSEVDGRGGHPGRRPDRDRGRPGAAARARPAPGRAARAVPRKAAFRRPARGRLTRDRAAPRRTSAGLHSRGSRRYGERACSMSRSQRNRRHHRGRGRPRNKAFLAIMVVLVLVALAGLSAVGYVISIAASAPPLDSLKPRELGSQSEVRAADGTRLGFIQSNELRRPVQGNQIPKSLKDATVAIEDERYYHHKGVDYAGVVRAAVKNLSSHKTVQGGSTITMQLVRNLYITKERTYQRKIREAKLAEELENEHSKDWILDKYLNTVPYGTLGGQTAVGVQAAVARVLRQAGHEAHACASPRCSPACRRRRAPTRRCATPRRRRRAATRCSPRWPSSR